MSIITFCNVTKRFDLGRGRTNSFQDLWVSLVKPWRRVPRRALLALDNVSFRVKAGEAVGFLGQNGAGKSSVLKLVANILEPTSGKVSVKGRISALLELGSGFHPELTGRENVFLNGSIVGLGRAEVSRRLDQIVAFAGLERFIDVPVKYYSSGMYVRLGFSVAIHTDPEILLVDEVLAVGDQDFQHKCLQQIRALKRRGVTIVLVSHSLSEIETHCDRAIWIQDGKVVADGRSITVADQYRSAVNRQIYRADADEPSAREASTAANRWGTQDATIARVQLMDGNQATTNVFQSGDPMRIRMFYRAPDRIDAPAFGVAFYRSDGLHINGPNSVRDGVDIPYIAGEGYVDYIVDSLPLNCGEYELTAAMYNRNSSVAIDHHHRQYRFRVVARSYWREEGVVHIPARWRHQRIDQDVDDTQISHHADTT